MTRLVLVAATRELCIGDLTRSLTRQLSRHDGHIASGRCHLIAQFACQVSLLPSPANLLETGHNTPLATFTFIDETDIPVPISRGDCADARFAFMTGLLAEQMGRNGSIFLFVFFSDQYAVGRRCRALKNPMAFE
jgi:hypothetical protein